MPRILSVSTSQAPVLGRRWSGGCWRRGTQIGLLGCLFHQLFGQLTGPDPHVNLVAPLQLADATLDSSQEALTTHAYKTFVAATLSAHQANLQAEGAEVIAMDSCSGIVRMARRCLFEQHEYDSLENNRARIFAGTEHDVSAEFSDPSWSDTVIVQGRADSILVQRILAGSVRSS